MAEKLNIQIRSNCSAGGKLLARGKVYSVAAAEAKALVAAGRASYIAAPIEKLTTKTAPQRRTKKAKL
jgi:hypothetical protein